METSVMNEDIRVSRLRRLARAGARGVTLVEVLIVVAIMAVISGGVTLVAFPLYRESRIKIGVQGCQAVKQAAELYQNLDATGDACPTIQDLVTSRKLDGQHTEDPWGVQYRIDCSEGEIRVWSNGNDRKPGTADDLKDNFKPADINRVKVL
jgi:general secretion pathway protein G